MNENNTHPLTKERAAELWDTHAGNTVAWDDWYGGSQRALTSLLRAAYDAGGAEWKANAEAAAERAERAEDRLVDSVHVDEAALRVESAREQGWDDAADWVKQREVWTDEELRAANPHRPAPALPTEDGAVIVPAEGFEFIWVEGGRYFDRLTYSSRTRRWYGVAINGGPAWASFWYGDPETITPGTWRTV